MTTYAYTDTSALESVTDSLGRVTSYAYDALDRPVAVTEPDPDGAGGEPAAVHRSRYGPYGRLLRSIDPLGNVTSYVYDPRHRVTAAIDPEGGVTGYAWDDAGNLTSLTDPVGNTTTWVYDNLDRVTQETNELDKTRSYAYDEGLNLASITDRRGLKREFDFDALHRLTEERWLDASQQVIRTFRLRVTHSTGRVHQSTAPTSSAEGTRSSKPRPTPIEQRFHQPTGPTTRSLDSQPLADDNRILGGIARRFLAVSLLPSHR